MSEGEVKRVSTGETRSFDEEGGRGEENGEVKKKEMCC